MNELFNIPDAGWLVVLLSPFLMGLLNSKTTSTSQDNKAGASDDSNAATGSAVASSGLSDSSTVAGKDAVVVRDEGVNLGGAYKSTVTSTQVNDDGILNYGRINTGTEAGRDLSINSGVQVTGVGGDFIIGDGGAETASLAESLTSRFSDTVKILSTNAATASAGASASLGTQLQSALAGIKNLATDKTTDGLGTGAKVILAGLAFLLGMMFLNRRK